MDAETDPSEDRRGGEAEVSPWFEFGDGEGRGRGDGGVRTFGRSGFDDDYRDVVPGVDYVAGFRDARSAEAEFAAAFEEMLKTGGAWVRAEKLITRLGVGVLRVDMPVFVWREGLALMRDGLRYRSMKCGAAK